MPVTVARAFVASAVALALAGGALAVHVLVAPHSDRVPSAAREAPAGGAWSAAASFGSVAVERVERFSGADRGHGPGHERNPAVRGDELRLRVSARNDLDRAVPFSPGQFRLRVAAGGRTVAATNPNPPPAAIAAGARLRHELSFLVSERAAAAWLVFDDVGAREPVTIAIGRVR